MVCTREAKVIKMIFTDKFNAKYSNLIKKPQNLPKSGAKKPSLSDCYSCEHYERGSDLSKIGILHYCVSRGFDRILRKSYTDYKNIELLEICPKVVKKIGCGA